MFIREVLILKKSFLNGLILIILLVIVSYLTGCGGSSSSSTSQHPLQRSYKMGIGPIPRNFGNATEDDWRDMFEKIKETGEILLAQNPWRDSIETSGQIPEIIALAGLQKNNYCYLPVYGINFFDQANGVAILNTNIDPTNDWSNNDAKQKYRDVALAICQVYQPQYLALGIEVNTYYSKHPPEEFDRFVEAYKYIYNEIKKSYPNTKVFVTFQLEQMKGLGTAVGYLGTPQWDLIAKFAGKLDLIAFTTYPEVEYNSPNEIPTGYYSEIKQYSTLPVAFTEIGWSSANGFTGLETAKESTPNQSRFIGVFKDLINGMDVEVVNWAFMHDLPDNGPLTKIGLRKSNGDAKPGWYDWIKMKNMILKE